MPPIVQQRRGTLAALTAANEVPLAGQIVFETDTNKLKVGDGTTAYNSLPYIVGGSASGSGGGSALNRVLNSLTFNGTTTTFDLVIGTTSVTPATAASLLILLNGVVQTPDASYTVTGSQITFSVAPAATDTFFGVYLAGAAATFHSPTQITADQNNYALNIGANNARLSSDAPRTITGFVASAGSSVTLHNVGSFPITVAHQSTLSAAANRVISPTGGDVVIPVNSAIQITYDPIDSRWLAYAVVRSAIEAWWGASSDKSKLDGIATGATANATDAQLRDRTTHTGQQAISTVTGLQDALDGKQPSGSYAPLVHQHTISAVDGLQDALDGKQPAGSYAATVHSHTIAQVTGLQTSLDSKQAAGDYAAATHFHTIAQVSGLQSALNSLSPITHGHLITDIDGLSAALAGKQAAGNYAPLVHQHVIGDTTGLQAALDGKQPVGSYAQSVHNHGISSVIGLQAALDARQLVGDYATLVNGKVPATQLPSYVDDVLEFDTRPQFPASGEEGKIYIAIDTSTVYRWSGSVYVEISGGGGGGGPSTTDSLPEGTTNRYFTNSRAVSAVQSLIDAKADLAHQHSIADVTGLTAALSGKQAAGSYATLVGGKVPESQLPPLASSWESLAGKPSVFPPSSHTHVAADISDFTTAVIAAAPPTTNASLLTSGTISAARLPNTVVFTTDSRLSDARQPLVHQHVIGDTAGLQAALDSKQAAGSYAAAVHSHALVDIVGLQAALDSKQQAGSYASSAHTHTASQITDFTSAVIAAAPPTTDASLLTQGTLSASRLPNTVVFTTDSRLSDARVPLSHQHVAGDVTGLQAALDAKAAASHTHTLADLTQSGATNGQVPQWSGSAWVPATPSSGGIPTADVQVFSAPGTHSWQKPAGARAINVVVVGGGGGGGSGRKAASGASTGGAGGGGGGYSERTLDASIVGSPVTVTVGAGGAGGAAQVNAALGINGVTGGASSFGSLVVASGGGFGFGGGAAGGQGAGGSRAMLAGASGGGRQTGAGSAGVDSAAGGGGGGAGGGFAATPVNAAGGAGGSSLSASLSGGNGTAGTAGGGAGGAGASSPINSGIASHGGGGGGSSLTGNGGNGGNGGLYGGGGGGGGAAVDGAGNSGAGGNGGDGIVIVTTYF